MSVSYPTKVLLAFRSGGICAICRKHLIYDAVAGSDTYVAEAAHIRGEKPGAPRYDVSMTDEARDGIDNLIYLCTDDHTVIDKVAADWPVDRLDKLKADHERKAREAMIETFAEVAFPELVSAVSWVASNPPSLGPGSFDVVPPDEKIKKNELSDSVRHVIAAGLVSRATVAAFVESEAQLDSDFPEKLKAGFLSEYYRLKLAGRKGDELFELMCAFAQRGMQNQVHKTAGIAILIYLFEICDVFEK